MAQWFKLPDNSYVQINQVVKVLVGPDPNLPPGTFAILGDFAGGIPETVLSTGFATLAAAQTALDNAITTKYGGS